MTQPGTKKKTTRRTTFEELDAFRLVLGHVGIPHDLYKSPKGKIFIRFDRPIEGDNVAVQYRRAFTKNADGSERIPHYRVYIGEYEAALRQDMTCFERLEELVAFLGIDPQAVLDGEAKRTHLPKSLQLSSPAELDAINERRANKALLTEEKRAIISAMSAANRRPTF